MFLRLAIFILCAPVLFIVFETIRSYIDEWRYDRKSRELGCSRPVRRPYRIPGGLDLIQQVMKADRVQRLPPFFDHVVKNQVNGAVTWEQFFFGKLNILTCEPRNIQALLATQFKDFELGPMRNSIMCPLIGNGIFTSDGAMWEHSRALLRPQFTRGQISDVQLQEGHVQDVMRHLSVDESGWTSKVDLQPIFFRQTLDSATEFLFGESVESQVSALPPALREKLNRSSSIGLDPTRVATAFDRGTHALGVRFRFQDLHKLYNPKSFRDDIKVVHQFADYYVSRALRRRAESKDGAAAEKGDKYVFLDELTQHTQDPIELRSQLLNIFLAGRDTTAGLLGWVFWNLARHPEIYSKLRASVLDSFGPYTLDTSAITFESLKNCTYLQHVMSETLRLFPTVPSNSRRAIRDTTLPTGGGPNQDQPIFVPKDVQVDYVVHVMHKRKDLWGEDAEQFKPERWAGRKVGWEYLPFNGGPRICLGQQFALTEAGYTITRLVQRFDKIDDLDTQPENDPMHQYSVTTAPVAVPLRFHAAEA